MSTIRERELINLEQYSADGRLTVQSDGKVFNYREMIKVVRQKGRPLTKQEAEQYRIK